MKEFLEVLNYIAGLGMLGLFIYFCIMSAFIPKPKYIEESEHDEKS
jgi:hypothetical protein